MKAKLSIILLVFFTLSAASCSKSSDPEPQDGPASSLPFNLKNMVSYAGQDYDKIRSTLDKYAILDKTSMGDRNFSVTVTDEPDIKLSGKIEERNGKVELVSLEYWGGNHPIGDPYENELWYKYMIKAGEVYGEATYRDYVDKYGDPRRLQTNTALIDAVKEYGYSNASYWAVWYLDNKSKELRVYHSNAGRFQLQIKLR